MNEAFIQPPRKMWGAELRPWSAGVEIQLETARKHLKARLDAMYPQEGADKSAASASWYAAACFYLLTGNASTVRAIIFDEEKLFHKVQHIISQVPSAAAITEGCAVIEEIREEAKKANNFKVESDAPTDPNS